MAIIMIDHMARVDSSSCAPHELLSGIDARWTGSRIDLPEGFELPRTPMGRELLALIFPDSSDIGEAADCGAPPIPWRIGSGVDMAGSLDIIP